MKKEFEISEEEYEKSLIERMACEAGRPETKEQKMISEARIKRLNELAEEERKRQGLNY
ncbi:MAG: hypothetical protein MRZ59_01475 [Clostridiales bacterium]|nr:hypothetical protein [Clostridiales bacterium]MDY3745415.1 hypothetical protein [Lachnospiraceae bacterium]